jgi:hypothetical protein
MKPKIKARWLAALRSGEYEQGRGYLHPGSTFCCLGVLCDLHAKATGREWDDSCKPSALYLDSNHTLPIEVVRWAGLEQRDPDAGTYRLSEYNDGSNGVTARSLTEIADLIEAYL